VQTLVQFLRSQTVLVVSAVLALVSCFLVPPSLSYVSYVDWRVLGLLFSLMAVVAGLRTAGTFRVLTEFDAMEPVALARTGELLYLAGRADDAVLTLERAAVAAGSLGALEPSGLRTLADAYLQLGAWEQAEGAYRAYIGQVGEADAGNAPELLAAAAARASGEAAPEAADAIDQLVGQQVFVANCAQCHGLRGEGGVGPQLAGSSRAANRANVDDAVRFGRGVMPAFQAQLSPEQLDAVVGYVTGALAAQQ